MELELVGVLGSIFSFAFLGDGDSVAEADHRQSGGTGHFVSQGTADAQEFSSFLYSKGQSFMLHDVILGLDRTL